MGILELILVNLALTIVFHLLKPKVEASDSPGDFRPPEPREGEPIPVVFGTVKVSPAVTWFGDVDAVRLTRRESTLFGLISEDIPLGFAYFAGMQLVLCHGPIDEVLDIHIGEYHVVRLARPRVQGANPAIPPRTPWTNTNPSLPQTRPVDGQPTRVVLNLPNLFGGPEEGGGIAGPLDIHWGVDDQGQNDYLALRWGPDILPQYRGVSYIVLRRMYMGKSQQPQPWQFVVRRIPKVLGQDTYSEIIDGDGNGTANAAECLYEILTNDVWGVGMRASDIDIASFQAAAQTLWNEDLGYCGQITTQQSAQDAVRTILSHVNGLLYQDPITGDIGLKLIRPDYTVSALPEFTQANAVLEEFRRGDWAEVVNETSVKYTDIGRRFSEGSVQYQNLAAIQAMNGEIVTQEISLPGLTTFELALEAAARAGRVASVPLNRGRLTTNRYGYALHQGSPFRISFPDFGIQDLVCRVTTIDYGSLTEGRMQIEFIEDPFNSLNPYGDPTDGGENQFCGPLSLQLSGYDPSADPVGIIGDGNGEATIFEAPYWHVGEARRAWAHVSRRTNSELHWVSVLSEHGGTLTRDPTVRPLMPTGLLDQDLLQRAQLTGVQFTVRDLGDLDTLTSTDAAGRLAGERLAIIDNGRDSVPEIIAWESIASNGDGTYTVFGVMRGVLDTVPLEHQEGARVYFYWNESGGESADDLSSTDYPRGQYLQLRPVRVELDGSEPAPANVSPVTVTMKDRAFAPAPPGNVRLDDSGVELDYPVWPLQTTGDIVLRWTHRSRTEPTAIIPQDDTNTWTLEGDITVQVLIRGVVVREYTNLTGTSQAYTYADYLTDVAGFDCTPWVQFRIIPIGTGGEVGTIRTTPRFTMIA